MLFVPFETCLVSRGVEVSETSCARKRRLLASCGPVLIGSFYLTCNILVAAEREPRKPAGAGRGGVGFLFTV